ncbi:MAG: hypothetical protein IID44_10730 [Planctomycetes bacterium]|nr:hypothetical protein [Planctomycetota bacterium]
MFISVRSEIRSNSRPLRRGKPAAYGAASLSSARQLYYAGRMSRVLDQYRRACLSLAGGVSASTRVNSALGHAMLFERAEGCRVWDLDGR